MARHETPLLLACLLGGCAQLEQVSVGQTGGPLAIDQCLGKNTQCQEASPSHSQTHVISDRAAVDDCVPSQVSGWHVAWKRSVAEVRCAPLGYCTPRKVVLGSDGTFWTASVAAVPVVDSQASLAGVFLGHYDGNGAVLAEKVVETRTLRAEFRVLPGFPGYQDDIALAADARGHAFVVTTWNDLTPDAVPLPPESSLSEYDATGKAVGGAVPVTGLNINAHVDLSVATDNALFMLVSVGGWLNTPDGPVGTPSVLAKLDVNLTPTWMQNRGLASALRGPLIDAQGKSTIVAIEPNPDPMQPPGTVVGFYDDHGNPAQRLSLAFPQAVLGVDALGAVFTLERPDDPSPTLRKISGAGEVSFRTRVSPAAIAERTPPGVDNPTLGGTLDTAGNTYLTQAYYDSQGMPLLTQLIQIDASGEHCSLSNITDEEHHPLGLLNQLLFGPDGSMFFASPGLIGRLTRD